MTEIETPEVRVDPREEKLPKWAREEFARLRRRAVDADRDAETARLATDPAQSDTLIEPYKPVPVGQLRVVNGAALSEAIADVAAQLPPGSGAGFALIAALWNNLPIEAVEGIVHHAAAKVGSVGHRETFADYEFEPIVLTPGESR